MRAWGAALAVLALYDELWSGIGVVAAPLVEEAHAVDHAGYALLVFALPLVLSAIVEAPIALASDRLPRRPLLAASLVTLAGALAWCALATSAWGLSLGLALAGAASGAASAVAEAELIALYAGRADRAMSRWTAFAAAGDVMAPLWVAGSLALGMSYRFALGGVAALIGAHAAWAALGVLWRRSVVRRSVVRRSLLNADDGDKEEGEPEPGVRVALKIAIRRPRLWLLLLAASMCTFLDEIVVAMAALRLHEVGWGDTSIATVLAALSLGALGGALATDRIVSSSLATETHNHVVRRWLLTGSATLAMAALILFVLASSPWLVTAALMILGLAVAPHYALLQAAAYEAAPGRPGLVNALSQVFVIVDVVAPLVIGVLAVRFGLVAALLSLGLQPVVVILVAWLAPSPEPVDAPRIRPAPDR